MSAAPETPSVAMSPTAWRRKVVARVLEKLEHEQPWLAFAIAFNPLTMSMGMLGGRWMLTLLDIPDVRRKSGGIEAACASRRAR